MQIRRLHDGDREELERFLSGYAETSMYLRSNARKVGLEYRGEDFQGEYFAAFDAAGNMAGVLAHNHSGRVLMQAVDKATLTALVAAFREAATRPIAGFLGPDEQVEATVAGLGLSNHDYAMNKNERLYALELAALVVPPQFDSTEMVEASQIDRAILAEWIRDNELETQGAQEGEELDAEVEWQVQQIIAGDYWALVVEGQPVALSGFTAHLPDIVQIGSVWTPPQYRNRGYARALVALTLQKAREQGVKKAILFTDNPAAVKAYTAIGFTQVGSYRIALLKRPVDSHK